MLGIRKISAIGRTYRHLNRYRRILAVMIKYGFGELFNTLGIDTYLEAGRQIVSRKDRAPVEKLSRPERVRMALAELGPTTIKFGQMLSTRPDLIPVEYVRELSRLQDKVPPCGFESIREIIEAELHQPIEDVFEAFETTPLASASIGQVYGATYKNDEPVAVKVQRPGIRRLIEVDLEIMLYMATLMERHLPEAALHKPVLIVEEFKDRLEKEVDYATEAASMERMARLFLSDSTVFIPKVYRDVTTARMLTTEYVEGIKISRQNELLQAKHDTNKLIQNGADLYLTQIFEHGFFHGDPHPGNIFALPGDVIGLIDFGLVGTVDRKTREDFVDLVDAMARQNEGRVAQILLRITRWEKEPDVRSLERHVSEFLGRHLYKPLKEIEVAVLLQQLLDLMSRYQLRIPPNLFLMIKALSTVDSVARSLDPDFDLIGHATPFIEKVKLARLHPQRITEESTEILLDLLQFIKKFPRDILDVTRLLRQQKFSLKMEQADLSQTLSTYDQISNRLAFSIVIAALIIGSALIVISEIPPLLFGISLIGIVGFLSAAVLGIWLLLAILKKGRL